MFKDHLMSSAVIQQFIEMPLLLILFLPQIDSNYQAFSNKQQSKTLFFLMENHIVGKNFTSILGGKPVKGKMGPGKVWPSTEVANPPDKESCNDP